jgi:hypothetical protein
MIPRATIVWFPFAMRWAVVAGRTVLQLCGSRREAEAAARRFC